ncbi:hypothetical protein B0A52_04218 [Exophiala mesophila]|uniref:Tubby C-terminal-like domain-containing protein n=1 Tax=Exophiala mesophila TaxID=212818 RepID=A0A438N851_EXOME|nr:hypothetical protein B0A52_04218 [Exophiala mesophila]
MTASAAAGAPAYQLSNNTPNPADTITTTTTTDNNNNNNNHDTPPYSKHEHSPPSYRDSVPQALTFSRDFGHDLPLNVVMTGDYRSPDFEVRTKEGEIVILQVETESTLVYHHSYIRDLRPNGPGGIGYTMKRKQNGDQWLYTIHSSSSSVGGGEGGVKLLEIATTSKIVRQSSTRLVFRSTLDGELDALYLNTSIQNGIRRADVVYQGNRIGGIAQLRSDDNPRFDLKIEIPHVDPLLLVLLALVLDDRLMKSRRRLKRKLGSGFAGIGKGPGAGLAGAYAIGGMG